MSDNSEIRNQPAAMKVLFSRRQNDFEHVYELPSAPRVGETVGLLDSPAMSFARQFVVTAVHWSPDHTAYDVSVALEELPVKGTNP